MPATKKKEALTAGLQMVPFSSTFPSELNPRKDFEPSSIIELANSIVAQGLQQNLVGRPVGDQIEIIAGGRRWSAIRLAMDTQRLPEDFQVPVRVLPNLSDLEALEIATLENVQRRSMHAWEEADAFSQMAQWGEDPKEIARKVGYNLQTVHDRIAVATKLFPKARKALEKGEINLTMAAALALAATEDLQNDLLEQAKRSTPEEIQKLLKQGTFLVQYAKFDHGLYTGVIVEDLFNTHPPYFADKQKAIKLQIEAVRALADQKRSDKKKKHPWVEVVLAENPKYWPSYSDKDYEDTYGRESQKHLCGLAYLINSRTGEVTTCTNAAKREDIRAWQAQQRASQQASNGVTATEDKTITKALMEKVHALKAGAVRQAICENPRVALVLSIISATYNDYRPNAGLTLSLGSDNAHGVTEGLSVMLMDFAINTTIQGKQIFLATDTTLKLAMDPVAAYEALTAQSDAVLLQAWALASNQTFAYWSRFSPESPTAPLTNRVADHLQVNMREHFVLTEDHLKVIGKDLLVTLAEDAGIRDQVAQADKRSDRIGVFMAHAQELAQKGWIPPVVKFPESDQ